MLGSAFKVSERRGQAERAEDHDVIATVHPSSVLRAPDRDEAYQGFLADLRVVRAHLG
ncbi:hypothetical protein B0I31_111154 [Saccharothrix carnea]|uniref:Uracil DNA glycosylase superfamily protein n=1 Tax=Saccharothrix carnea TaxID=1280637 RepID=A0A2P8I321_SACCR|nr:hypothetical protein B0I31_111154 [Saccharothrix carnea]